MSALTVTALASELINYVDSSKGILMNKVVKDQLPDVFTPVADVKTKVPITDILIGDIAQPGGKNTFNATAGAVVIANRYLEVFPAKVDLLFSHTEIVTLHKMYLGQVDSGKIDPQNLPLEEYLFAKIISRFRKNVAWAMFKGVLNPSGTGKVDILNGLLTLITTDVASGAIPAANVKQYGSATPITNANALDIVSDLQDVASLNDDYGDEDMVVLMGKDKRRMYNKDYQATNGALPYNTNFDKQKVDGTDNDLIGVPFMNGSNRLIQTPKENLFYGYDSEAGLDTIIVERFERNIKIMMDVYIGVNYGAAELVWVNNYTGIA